MIHSRPPKLSTSARSDAPQSHLAVDAANIVGVAALFVAIFMAMLAGYGDHVVGGMQAAAPWVAVSLLSFAWAAYPAYMRQKAPLRVAASLAESAVIVIVILGSLAAVAVLSLDGGVALILWIVPATAGGLLARRAIRRAIGAGTAL